MKLAILYAGQGSQHPGMGKDLYERYPAFREAFNAADLDFDLESVCFDDPEGVLNLTQYTQPCMVAFAAGVTAVLKENGIKADYLAGLSLGEYSALEAAGVFTAKQAVELAAFRGKAMADAASTVADHFAGKIAYVAVMKNLSVDCDCCAVAENPCMGDIGILSGLDPVALDRACIDLVINSNDPGRDHFMERVNSRHGAHTIEAAEALGVGTTEYELVRV
mgnify:CR=1 FL=1